MIERARALFPNSDEQRLFSEAIQAVNDRQKYQAAMQFVIECRGQADMIVETLSDATLANRGDWECDEMYSNWLKGNKA